MCNLGNLVHRPVERDFIGFGRPCEAAQFADKLQRRSTNFVIRRRGHEIMQRFDISAHDLPRYLKPFGRSSSRALMKICAMGTVKDKRDNTLHTYRAIIRTE